MSLMRSLFAALEKSSLLILGLLFGGVPQQARAVTRIYYEPVCHLVGRRNTIIVDVQYLVGNAEELLYSCWCVETVP